MSEQVLNLDQPLYDYLRSVSLREPEILRQLRKETAALGNVSRMQISAVQGQFMKLLAELIQARNILEIGAFTGYSALVCALALPEDGRLITCDIDEDWTRIARKYWEKAGVAHKIELRLAPALATLEELLRENFENAFDMAFIDADKQQYNEYYELALKLIRPGGLILIDNVLWGGAVIDTAVQDPGTTAIRALNEKLREDNRVSISMLPVGDGLTLARKGLPGRKKSKSK